MRAWIRPAARAATVAIGLTFAVACGGGDGSEINVDTLEPNQGPLGGGQVVTISGDGFLAGGAAPNLALVGDMLTTEVMALSDKELQIVTPPGTEPGEVEVVVFNSNGFGVSAMPYTYLGPPEVTSVDPPAGDWQGGDEVTITGSGFQDFSAGTNSVTFDGRLATEVVAISDTELTAIVPQGAPYKHATVSVSNLRGYGEATDAYEYTIESGAGLIGITGRPGILPDKGQGIYFIDPSSGQYELLHSLEGMAYPINGLATASDGTIYATAPRDNLLYTVDPERGVITPVGPFLSFGNKSSIGRPSDPAFLDGELLAYEKDMGLVSISTETGQMTSIGPNLELPTSGRSCVVLDGLLFYMSNVQAQQLDPDTGVAIGEPRTLPVQRLTGGTTHDGQFYFTQRFFTFGGGGGNTSIIWRIDPDSLSATEVARIPAGLHALTVAP